MATVSLLPLPIKGSAARGYGSAIRPVADDEVLTSWIEGASAVRLGRVDVQTARVNVIKGARGLLRDALVDRARGSALVLCTHGLHEVDLERFAIVRSLTKGMGSYNYSMVQLSGDVVGVSRRFGRRMTLVSRARMEIVGHLAVDQADIAVPSADGLMLLSFTAGTGRLVSNELVLRGRRREVPRGATPVLAPGGVAYLPGESVPPQISPEIPDGFDTDRYSTVVPDGRVALLDIESLTSDIPAEFTPFRSLHGVDDDGALVGSDRGHGAEGRTLYLRSREPSVEMLCVPLTTSIMDVAILPTRRAVAAHASGNDIPNFLSVVTW